MAKSIMNMVVVVLVVVLGLSLSISGSADKDVHDLLKENKLPPGLLPDNVESYTFDDENEFLTVKLKSECTVDHEMMKIHYKTTIFGVLFNGAYVKISGINLLESKVPLPLDNPSPKIHGFSLRTTTDSIDLYLGSLGFGYVSNFPNKIFENIPSCIDTPKLAQSL